MPRKLTAVIAALAFALTALAPASVSAQHRRDDYRDYRGDRYEHYDRHRHRGRHYYRDHDDDDAVAAGVIGLVLGLTLGALASQPQYGAPPRVRCAQSYQRCAPPQGYDDQRYYDESGLEGGYDPRFEDDSAYARDYGAAPPQNGYRGYAPPREQCIRRERQWDRYANRYVIVDVPC